MIDYSLRSPHAGIKMILHMIYHSIDLKSIRAEELVWFLLYRVWERLFEASHQLKSG